MKSRTIAVLIGIALSLGIPLCKNVISQARAELSLSEEEIERQRMEQLGKTWQQEKARQKEAMEKRDHDERRSFETPSSKKGDGEKMKDDRGGYIERRPGGCPEGPSCKGRP